MMITSVLLVSTALCMPLQEPNTLSEAERADGWTLAFDGETGAGWRRFRGEGFPARGWVVEQGTLHKVAGAGGGDLVSENAYQDFEFAFEWKVAAGANTYKYVAQCANRGTCDSATGVCKCFKGYANDNCNKQNMLAM